MELTDKLPWHGKPWAIMTQYLVEEKLPHALLLSGAKGIGKQTFIKTFIKQLLCEQRTACGSCQSCQYGLSHPDLYWVESTDKLISVDTIREVTGRLALTAAHQIKVAVILNADRMNRAAANALLKSLEEPKGDVCYLLTSARPFNLPKTILSRCQTLLFRDATEKEVTDYHALSLQEQSPWVKSKVLGSPLIYDTIEQLVLIEKAVERGCITLINQGASPLMVSEHWQAYPLDDVLSCLNALISNAFWQKVLPDPTTDQAPAQSLLAQMRKESLSTILDKISQLLTNFASERQLNQKLWLDELVIFVHKNTIK